MQKTLLLIFHSTSLWFLAGIWYHTPNLNPQNQVVVPELDVLLADAHRSEGGTSKANSNQGHSYCSLEPPCCHKAGILSPFICFHSPDKSQTCGGSPQMCARSLISYELMSHSLSCHQDFPFSEQGTCFIARLMSSWSTADRGVGLESLCANNSQLQVL